MRKYTPLERYKIRRKYKKYVIMKKEGKSDREIYLTAKSDGINALDRLEILRNICNLSFGDAKELILCTNSGAESLSEYQEKYVLPTLKEAFKIEAQEQKEDASNNKQNGQ